MARVSEDKDAHHQPGTVSDRAEQHVFVLRSEWKQFADRDSFVLSSLSTLEQIVQALQQHSTEEVEILHSACRALVDVTGYAGAMGLTLENQQELRLRGAALRLPPHKDDGLLLPALNSLLQSENPLLRLDEPGHAHHLALRALAGSGRPLESDHLHDLLGPLLNTEEATRVARLLGVARVLALPLVAGEETWGCLLLMSHRDRFAPWEKQLLSSLAQQMALGLHNARLYRRVEEQRRAAQTFARMAFSASAYLHTLRSQIGSFRTYLDLVQMLPQMPPEQQREVIGSGRRAYESLDQATDILDHLHEPWHQHPQVATDVNDCLTMALLKLFPRMKAELRSQPFTATDQRDITVHCTLAPAQPAVYSSPDMLTEVFRIAISNAVDAVVERPDVAGTLWIESNAGTGTVCVTVRDNGVGIPARHVDHIFELGWSTKQGQGMGFGLFWAKSFIEGLGGHIEVHSEPQQGTTFHFVLPAAES